MEKIKVLFVCIHNSARSQMAEAYLNALGNGKFVAESAGIEQGKLNPVVVEAMRLDGIDISQNGTDDVFEFLKEGRRYHYLITVCDETSAERCPIFPGAGQRIHWSFEDPSALKGTFEEKLTATLPIRDSIKMSVQDWILTMNETEK